MSAHVLRRNAATDRSWLIPVGDRRCATATARRTQREGDGVSLKFLTGDCGCELQAFRPKHRSASSGASGGSFF
jgi:hypothetical protein